MATLAPIALFTFKRLEHTQKTVAALKDNLLAKESDLIVFADGPRNAHEAIETNRVRQFLRGITGFKSVRIIEKDANDGLSKSITSGVTNIVNEYGRVIVLEDDLVTSRYFLMFMNAGLDKYQDEEKVGCIHGYVYPLKTPMDSPFFLRGADCWGWATWKRSWDLLEKDGLKLMKRLKASGLADQFDYGKTYPYTKMLRDQINGKNNSWAILWYCSLFLADRLCLYPNVTLVENLGFDGTGTHCSGAQAGIYANGSEIKDNIASLNHSRVQHSLDAYERFRAHFYEVFAKGSWLAWIKRRLLTLV